MPSADASTQPLKPADELAQSRRRFPGESPQYRAARNALLKEEIELRRHIERVAAQRRALPPGGEIPQDYRFESETGPATLSQMFGEHDTLVTYNWMFGPKRQRSCPMCTSFLSALDGEMADILQRVAFAVIARSPVERLTAFKRERGWRHLRLYSSGGNTFNRDYADEDPEQRRQRRLQRIRAVEWHRASFLGRRDGPRNGRSRPGPARGTGRHAAMDRARHDAGRARHGLVSETGIRRSVEDRLVTHGKHTQDCMR